ncbi:hypothetical protein J5N97_006167 [Dioscorea zingiberensis]|uniref:Uncharacterized protein n=1 Tax=Dioscorea zingiberensis TaxID=325984 RepID=A0A9D5HTF5_9LILI|nr:hypothetical protein J5N97_006167 [Dioscorea zingiberensis]
MGVPKTWLSDLRAIVGNDGGGIPKHEVIGILAFEAAATMSHLVSLHKALSENELHRLRSVTMRSQGVSYLNSTDQSFLLRLACAELMSDLDRVADAISRLETKSRAPHSKSFIRVYTELKSGNSEQEQLGPGIFCKKKTEKKVKKMEKYIYATSKLCMEMEAMDVSRQKLNKQCNRFSGPIPITTQSTTIPNYNNELFIEIKSQEQRIQRLKEESLWNRTFDKVVRLMSAAVFSIFARVCSIFGPFVPGLPTVVTLHGKSSSIWFAPVSKLRIRTRLASSGPIERRMSNEVPIRNSCPIIGGSKEAEPNRKWNEILEAPPNTVGGSCMALRYADVIVSAEKFLFLRSSDEPMTDKEVKWELAARDEFYGILPRRLRGALRRKLRECRRDAGSCDGFLAEGWKDAVERILKWLGPMAHDTQRWQAERNMDRRQWFDPKPKALLLQTLHFSNMEKTEAAIVEVLVGLSCVWMCMNCPAE